MSINLHFTDDDWDQVERAFEAWWVGELDRPLVTPLHIRRPDDATPPEAHSFTSTYPLDMPADAVLDCYQHELEARRFRGHVWPKWWPNFGPGIIAGFLGCCVTCTPTTVWFEPAEDQPIETISLRYDANNVWLRRILELTRAAVRRWGDRVGVSHTDLGGNLDILASIRGTQNLLTDLHDAPDEVERLAGEITRLWIRYYEELEAIIRPAGRGTTSWAPLLSSGRCYMLQCDFSYIISQDMFEQFVMPDLRACCEFLDRPFYHLDGKGQIPHLDLLLSIDRLRGIQWIPGDGQPKADEWLPVLQRIRAAGKLCQVFVTPQGALKIARSLGGRGFQFCITTPLLEHEVDELIAALAASP